VFCVFVLLALVSVPLHTSAACDPACSSMSQGCGVNDVCIDWGTVGAPCTESNPCNYTIPGIFCSSSGYCDATPCDPPCTGDKVCGLVRDGSATGTRVPRCVNQGENGAPCFYGGWCAKGSSPLTCVDACCAGSEDSSTTDSTGSSGDDSSTAGSSGDDDSSTAGSSGDDDSSTAGSTGDVASSTGVPSRCHPACPSNKVCSSNDICVLPGEVGAPCTSDAQCTFTVPGIFCASSGFCDVKSLCPFECTDGKVCGQVRVGYESQIFLVPGCVKPGENGAPCTGNDECKNGTAPHTCTTDGFCSWFAPRSSSSSSSSSSTGGRRSSSSSSSSSTGGGRSSSSSTGGRSSSTGAASSTGGRSSSTGGQSSSTGAASSTGGSAPRPLADCTLNGKSYCKASESCVQGLCIPSTTDHACNPPCVNGATCNVAVGVCVASSAPPSCDSCPSGQCQQPAFPSAPVTCIPAAAAQCSPESPCASGSNCANGYCFSCGELCAAVPPAVFADLVNSGGFNASSFKGVSAPAEVAQLISSTGVLEAPAGQLLQINASVSALMTQLNFPAGRESTAASINEGASVSVPEVRGQSTGGRLIVGAGASFTGQTVQVDPSSSLTLSLSPAPNGGVTTAEMRSFNLSAGASINIVGDASTAFRFPANVTGTTGSSASASLQVSGAGVRIAGCTGPVPINIAAGADATASYVQVSRAMRGWWAVRCWAPPLRCR